MKKRQKALVGLVMLTSATALIAASPAQALPPPTWCVGFALPGTCTFTHLDPLFQHNTFVAVQGTGPVSVTLWNGSTPVLACTGINSCTNAGVTGTYPGSYTCVATGSCTGFFGCVVF